MAGAAASKLTGKTQPSTTVLEDGTGKRQKQFQDNLERYRAATSVTVDPNDDPAMYEYAPVLEGIKQVRQMPVSSSTSTPVSRMQKSQEMTALLKEKNRVENLRFPDAVTAEQAIAPKLDRTKLQRRKDKPLDMTKPDELFNYTPESIREAAKGNMTAEIGANQYINTKQIEEDLATSGSFEEAVIKNTLRKGGKTADQIEVLKGNIPDAMKGNMVMNFLQDENLSELIGKDQKLNSEVQAVIHNFPDKYPNAAIRIIAQMVSEEREKQGVNSAILNNPSVGTTKEIVDKLVQEGKLPENYGFFFEDPAVQFAVSSKIKTPGLVENFGKGLGEGILGIGKTVADVTQIRKLYSDKEDRMFNTLQKQYEDFNFKPKGLLHQITMHGGNITGQVLPMMAGGAAVRGAGLVKGANASNALMAGLQSFGENRDQALVDLPKADEATQLGYATLNTGIEVALSNVFNDAKFAKQLMRKAAPEVENIIGRFTAKEITEAAAKEEVETLFSKLISTGATFGKGMVKSAAKEANEEAGTYILQKANEQVFGGEKQSFSDVMNEAFDVWTTTFLGSGLLGAGGGLIEVRSKPEMSKVVFEMASNPDKYRDIIEAQAAVDPEYAKDVKQKLDNLDYAVQVKGELDKRNISEKNKEKFLLNSLSEKILQEKVDAIPDASLRKEGEKQLTEIQIEKDMQLNPDVTNTNIVQEFFDNDLLSKGDMMMLSDEKGKFSESKVGEYLKFIAQQANDLDPEWKPQEIKGKSKQNIPNAILEIANERWKKEIESAQPEITIDQDRELEMEPQPETGVSVMQPEEVTKPNVIETEKITSDKTIQEEANEAKDLIELEKIPFDKRNDRQHSDFVKQKFVKQFTGKGVPKEQVEAAVALMGARANSWASEEKGRTPEQWFKRIFDVKSGEFQDAFSDIKYQGEWKKVILAAAISLQPIKNSKVSVQNIGRNESKIENVSYENEKYLIKKFVQEYFIVNGDKAPQEVIDRAIEVWEVYGKPIISGDTTKTTVILDGKEIPVMANDRAYADMAIGKGRIKLGNITNMDDFIAEISHAAQFVSGAELNDSVYANQKDYDKYEYDRKGSVEYDAHTLIEPYLANYIFTGKKGVDLFNSTPIPSNVKAELDPVLKKYNIKFQLNKGALETLKDGRMVIHALTAPDFSTMVHEIAHVFESDLTESEQNAVKDFGGSEAFARGFERYLRNGIAPSKEMLPLFRKFRKWMMAIYESFVGTPIEKRISPEIKRIFDRLLTEQKTVIEDSEGVGEPPKQEPPVSRIHTEEPMFRLVKENLNKVRERWDMDEYEGESVSNIQAITNAQNTINEWKEKGEYQQGIDKIINDANNNKISDAGQNILAQHMADLMATMSGMDRYSPEYNKLSRELMRATEAGDNIRSEAGRTLGRNRLFVKPKQFDTVLDVEMDMMEDYGVDELTNEQKQKAEQRFNDLQAAFEKERELREKAEAEVQRLNAEKTIQKEKKKTEGKKKKSAEEYKKERKELLKNIGEKWRNAGKDKLSSDIPFRAQFAAISKDVAKLVYSYLDQGVANTLEEVRKLLRQDIQSEGIDISEEDTRRLLAGEFNEPRPTRNELSNAVRVLREEEKLLLELERLEAGGEPKDPKKAVIRNQKLKDIRQRIDKFYRENKLGKYSDEARNEVAQKLAQKAIDELQAKLDANDLSIKKAEQLKETKKTTELKKKRQDLADAIEQKRKDAKIGKYSDEAKFERAIQQQIVNNNKKREEFEEKIKKGDFSDPEERVSILDNVDLQKKNPKLYKDYLKSVTDKQKSLVEYEKKRLDDKIKNYSTLEKTGYGLSTLINTSKGTVAMFDQSGVFVQMLPTTLGHPLQTAKHLPGAIRDLFSPKWFDQTMAKMKGSSRWPILQKMGVAFYDPDAISDDVRNELLGGRKNLLMRDFHLGGKIGIGKYNVKLPKLTNQKFSLGKAFERSTATLFNSMRLYLANAQIEHLYSQGKTIENNLKEFEDAGRVINELTGHGKVQRHIAAESPLVNKIIWSPKMIASTMNLLGLGDIIRPIQTGREIGKSLGFKVKENKEATKGFYSSLTHQQRAFARNEVGRALGTLIAIYTISLAIGALRRGDDDDERIIDLRPNSVGFGDIQVGPKKINFMGRFGKAVRVGTQIISGSRKMGEKTDVLGETSNDKSQEDVLISGYGRGAMTPMAGFTYDMLLNNRKNYYTKEKYTPGSAARSLFVPLSFQEAGKDLDRDGTLKGLATTLGKIYGVQIRDERDFQRKPSPDKEITVKDETGKKRTISDEGLKEYNEKWPERVSELTEAYEKGEEPIWIDVNGDVRISKDRVSSEEFAGFTDIQYDDLTKTQKEQLSKKLTSKAKSQLKKELFNDETFYEELE